MVVPRAGDGWVFGLGVPIGSWGRINGCLVIVQGISGVSGVRYARVGAGRDGRDVRGS